MDTSIVMDVWAVLLVLWIAFCLVMLGWHLRKMYNSDDDNHDNEHNDNNHVENNHVEMVAQQQ